MFDIFYFYSVLCFWIQTICKRVSLVACQFFFLTLPSHKSTNLAVSWQLIINRSHDRLPWSSRSVTTKAVLLRVFLLRCAEEVLIATDGVQILRICKQYWFRHHWHPCKPMYAGLYQIDITLSSLDKISNDTTTDDEQGTYVI